MQLSGLTLKPEALEGLDLPLRVDRGSLGTLHVVVPWSSLGSQPVRVTVDELLVVCGPLTKTSFDRQRERQKRWELKKKQLEMAQLVVDVDKQNSADGKADEAADPGFVQSLTQRLVDNMQVTIRNVHFRFEDATHPTMPFALGIVLRSLQVRRPPA